MGAVHFGNAFEEMFYLTCNRTRGLAVTRFPDGCRVVGKGNLVRTKTPCDWVLTFGGQTALLDTKTTEGDSFPHSKLEPHQVVEMYSHSIAGAKTGYVIWFRKSDEIYFASSLLLNNLLNVRGSIKGNMMHFLGKSTSFKPTNIFGIN